jgi:hypothetical protein
MGGCGKLFGEGDAGNAGLTGDASAQLLEGGRYSRGPLARARVRPTIDRIVWFDAHRQKPLGGAERRERGQRWTAPAGVPALSGVVEHVSESPCNALLRLDKPGPGTAALGAVNCGGPIMVTLSFYLYGDQSAGTVASETPLWQAWIQERFPMPSEPSKSE